MTSASDLPELLLRLSRLAEAEGWDRGLNPAQAAALAYLARANRFSRAPSHLADWLGATRGTVSQTLKSLAARGLVAEGPAPRDRRSISYALTEAGQAALAGADGLAAALAALPWRGPIRRRKRWRRCCRGCWPAAATGPLASAAAAATTARRRPDSPPSAAFCRCRWRRPRPPRSAPNSPDRGGAKPLTKGKRPRSTR